ncbi:MAG: flap structure-specific endonuclease, partial [Candidatus Aenigmatarchaeota archaeon]
LEVGVTPVFVFDGKAPDFKASVQEERAKIRKEAEVKWRKAVEDGDLEKVRMYSQGSSKLTSSMIDEAKELLGLMGISWIQAPSEGEAQASYFAKQGKVWAAGSQDWDSLLFATPRLIRNLSISGRKKVPMKERYITVNPEIIDLEEVLSHLGITQDQLIILGMLVGTDYNPGGIKGVGPKGALKLVREEKTLENVLKKVKWEAESSPEKVFDFFKNPPVEDLEIKKEKYNYEALKEMLMDHDFSEERIENTLKKLDEKKKKGQSNLGKFFGT